MAFILHAFPLDIGHLISNVFMEIGGTQYVTHQHLLRQTEMLSQRTFFTK